MREFDVILNDNYREYNAFVYELLHLDFCTFKAKLALEQQAMPATVKKIMTAEPASVAIKVPLLESKKQCFEKGNISLSIKASGKGVLRYVVKPQPNIVPIQAKRMDLFYLVDMKSSSTLSINVAPVEPRLYNLFHADTSIISVKTTFHKNGLAVRKLIEGKATLCVGVLSRRAKLHDYRDWTLQSMSSRTLDELAYIHPHLTAKMYLESKPSRLEIHALKANLVVK